MDPLSSLDVERDGLSRLKFLQVGGGALAAASIATGGLAGAAASGVAKAAAGEAGGKEAPSLAALVRQGKLPPLAKRLPAKPVVVQPVDRLGAYGGTWHTGGVGADDAESWVLLTIFYENVVGYRLPWSGNGSISDVKGNLAESFSYNRAGTEYTFKLRRGIRWSDGAPFTAADVAFAVNDVAVNKILNPVPSSRFSGRDGSPCHAEQLDAYTVRLVFPTPNSLFLEGMSSAGGYVLHAPSHYLKQFHIKYNPNANQLAKKAGLNDWTDLFGTKNFPFDPSRPTVAPWVFKDEFGVGSQVRAVRNPYYWKVDPQGRQLPYLDEVIYSIYSDPQVELAAAANGQLDLHARLINTPQNKPVLASGRSKGKYHFFNVRSSLMNQSLVMLNQTSQDPVKRKIFQNKNFRIGLSYAINRKQIIDSVYAGQGVPWQAAPKSTSPWYDKTMATQYTKFSLAQANQYLDKAGYPMKNGARIGPDGNPIQFTITTANDYPDAAQNIQFITNTWKQVGIEIHNDNVAETLFFQRVTAGDHDAAVWGGDGGDNPISYPECYLPVSSRNSNYATQWAVWFETSGASGEKPPLMVRNWFTLFYGLRGTTNGKEQRNLMAKILKEVSDQFFVIGIASVPDGYGIVKNNFYNVPKLIPGTLTFPGIGPVHPEQFFI